MEICRSLESVPYLEKQLVLALGNFDGLHRGHRDLLAKTVSYSHQEGKIPGVFLFHPHPQHILNPAGSPKMLLDQEKKLEILAGLGIEAVFVIPFDGTMAMLSAEDFVKTILVEKLKVGGVFVGFNYRYGHRALGTPEQLRSYGKQYGFSVEVVPPFYVAGSLVSSTSVRAALEVGDVPGAQQLLGYWPVIRGVVTRGDSRGRLLGFPTANVAIPEEMIIPYAGVYAGSAKIGGCSYTTVVNIGSRPTFVDSKEIVIEAHLLQFSGSAYGESIEVELFKRLRGERRFESADALVVQIRKDIQETVDIGKREADAQDCAYS
jgi:riboflavin kinase/FMN adenylyltransferase